MRRVMSDLEAFIRANTRLLPVPFVGEIVLYQAAQSLEIWQKTEDDLQREGLPPPFWAFAWAGGQALARHILDNPQLVRGKTVLDLGSGSGLAAIAAALAGAADVLAADIDPFAAAAIEVNAQANNVTVRATIRDFLAEGLPQRDVVLVGDLFYERQLAERTLTHLEDAAQRGGRIRIGDPGRTYFPADRFHAVATYNIPVSVELEDREIKPTSVWSPR